MLVVLGLIDVVMISNLLIMVIVGGYETFVSRMRLEDHPDQPEWLSHVNASVLKVKLATAIIGISSIHLLKTFINAEAFSEKALLYQTVIHITFLLSALAIAARRPADAAAGQAAPRRRIGQARARHCQEGCNEHDPPARPHRERRRRAPVHLVLPPARLHHRAGRGLPRRGIAGREGRDRADPHQFADVRGRPPTDLPGHGDRRRVREGRHGRALGGRHDVAAPT